MKKMVKSILEILIILYRILSGKFIFLFLRVFPLEDKVIFSNFTGKCYGDNPRFISEKLHEIAPEIQQIWVERKDLVLDTPDYVKKVPLHSLKLKYEYATSKVWVDSHVLQLDIDKRKNQLFIDTWHGSFQIKKIENDTNQSYYDKVKSKHSVSKIDLFISNTDIKSRIYRDAFGYTGEILECGYPKNDIFKAESSEIREAVLTDLSISSDKKVFLYAPTFRDYGTEWLNLDYEKIYEALKERFGGEWVILVRLHPVMIKLGRKLIVESNHVKDVTTYGSMQHLLVATDVFLTDYSSGIYDFSLTRKPAFLYANDLEKYVGERGLYWDLEKDLPFAFSRNQEDLICSILQFDEEPYQDRLDKFFAMVGSKETGHAADDIASLIVKKITEG